MCCSGHLSLSKMYLNKRSYRQVVIVLSLFILGVLESLNSSAQSGGHVLTAHNQTTTY